ncbi:MULTISPECIES: hypothetical protein [unclassified Bradyrhizobium]|uniref:hypothetical protein n=1 Tax=unclassified Bradyrhizobium TaxID=2631580 RepID=UPI001CD25686|nr:MULTISPECIES: hypothetical protein [unclassified Bradyrhizobium]MCA1386027.1 hypothetical protein [Bradyrhizobium sp. BRP05]MCA1393825.1 hypothetical protein [Bradyrhizobium sp. IC3123]MCA1423469.1 hypothetical protein [Bradyrhizobium sp. BRP23]MCA1430637.1 hypothetical protein [Bradyrhizobium sp. NBAIM16]MCA1471213.1 hypothetical protein [Bradyrhizobium sp. IC3195]
MTKKIEARLAAIERKLNAKRHPTDKAFRILFVEGGPPGPISWAYAGTLRWKREANENLEEFAKRAADAAYVAGETALTVGGLPRGDERTSEASMIGGRRLLRTTATCHRKRRRG